MNLLCLDTSTDYATCIVGNDAGQLYGVEQMRHERSLSVRMYPLIESALAQAKLTVRDIDVFAAGIGPGSFTGVRVAVTTMRTLAQVTGEKLVGVCTLDIFAAEIYGSEHAREFETLYALLPSRRDEVYLAEYDATGNRLAAPRTAMHDEVRELAKNELAAFAGPAALLSTVFVDAIANLYEIDMPDVQMFLNLAIRQTMLNAFENPLALDPMYIAPPAVSQHKNTPLK